jgi:IS5 family transposase
MRKRIVAQRSLLDQAMDLVLSVFQPDEKLKKMDAIIEDNPDILNAIHGDLTWMLQDSGRSGLLSAERVFRSAVLKQWKRYSYRDLRERIHEGGALRWFCRFHSDPVPHFTALQKAIKSIQPATWGRINEILVQYARKKKIENGKSLRVDTTVVETNIVYPTDARLLWGSIRVLTRIMERSRCVLPELNFAFAKRTRRAKKRCYAIVMAKGPKAKQRRKALYKDLIKVANEVFRMACACCEQLRRCPHIEALAFHRELDHYLNMASLAIDQCERRVLRGQKVPASEKIVSIFEEHTDIIKRGKSQCPTEFGHKVLVSSGKSGLVTQYETFGGNPSDSDMLSGILNQHQRQYDSTPHNLCGDRRFFSQNNEDLAYSNNVKKVSICKPGYRSKARQQIEKQSWFKKLQRFRAGIEGIISVLMRSYGLKRCLWKGWRSFKSYVGLSVVTFNLQKLANLV